MKHLLIAPMILGFVAGSTQGLSGQTILSDLVVSAGALNIESTSGRVEFTFGQTPVGRAASTEVVATLGFWATPGTSEPTAIETIDADAIPERFSLDQNHPNPFNPTTTIGYAVSEPAGVRLTIHDVRGREIAELVNRRQLPGRYEVTFEAGDLPSGTYFYRLVAKSFTDIHPMVLAK